MVKLRLLGAAAAIAAMSASIPAQAVNFVLRDTGGANAGSQARIGFDIAALYWSSVLKDNVTINLDVGFRTLATGVLGSTGSANTLLSMRQGYTALSRDATSTLDATAVANLPVLGTSVLGGTANNFGAITFTGNALAGGTNGYLDTATRLDSDGGVNNSTLAITKASAKALGITTDVNNRAVDYTTPDGTITFSNSFAFDFDPTDGIASNAFDFIGVAIHEIGHALGFISGVDTVDLFTGPGGSRATGFGTLEGNVVFSQLDLFRYDKAGNLDLTTQSNPYFSIDGGNNQLFGDSRFSNGRFNGNTDPNGRGEQASHWRDSPAGQPQEGILDPTSGRGQAQEVTALDLAAYDAIGYNVNFDVLANGGYRYSTADAYRAFAVEAAIPEPATWAQMLMGFGLLGGAVRYRRRKTAVSFA